MFDVMRCANWSISTYAVRLYSRVEKRARAPIVARRFAILNWLQLKHHQTYASVRPSSVSEYQNYVIFIVIEHYLIIIIIMASVRSRLNWMAAMGQRIRPVDWMSDECNECSAIDHTKQFETIYEIRRIYPTASEEEDECTYQFRTGAAVTVPPDLDFNVWWCIDDGIVSCVSNV